MADFCKQCSIENFGEDFEDLAKIGSEPLEEGYGYPAICEGCGFILVNEKGECINCDLKDHDGKLLERYGPDFKYEY